MSAFGANERRRAAETDSRPAVSLPGGPANRRAQDTSARTAVEAVAPDTALARPGR